MTTLKLQKLVYYAQAWSLSLDQTALFDEKIEAWPNGPVIKDLYDNHRGQQFISSIADGDSEKLDEDQRAAVDMVLEYYGDKPVYWLERLSHSDLAWIEARGELTPIEMGDTEITIDSMVRSYCRGLIAEATYLPLKRGTLKLRLIRWLTTIVRYWELILSHGKRR